MREGGSNKEEGNASFNSSSDKRSWRRKNTKERNASEKGPVGGLLYDTKIPD